MSARKLAIVTGSNKGIGLETVKKLSREFDGDVILCARNLVLGEAAVRAIASPAVLLHQLDITSEDSVHNLRNFVKQEYGGIDLLINNAGYADMFHRGSEATLKTNLDGTISVTEAMLPLLRNRGVLINVSSNAGLLNWIKNGSLVQRLKEIQYLTVQDLRSIADEFLQDVDHDVTPEDKGWPEFGSYFLSKILLTAYTFTLQRRLDKDSRNLIVNAVHPGERRHVSFTTPNVLMCSHM